MEGTNKTLCASGPMRKEQWPYKRLTQTCLWVSRSIQQRRGLVVACCRVRSTECSSVCMGTLEGGCHYLHYLHHSLVSGQTIGKGTQHCPSTENLIKFFWIYSHKCEVRSYGSSIFVFLRYLYTFSTAVYFIFPPMMYKDSNFSLTSTLYSFNNIHLEPQKSQNCQKQSWGKKNKKPKTRLEATYFPISKYITKQQ